MVQKEYSSRAGDAEVQQMHERAVGGDEEARTGLMLWVYSEARRYYSAKAVESGKLSSYEAQELTSQFLLSFEASWRRVRRVTNYTRRGLKRNLARYLSTRRNNTVSIDDLDAHVLQEIATDPVAEPWMRWSDEAFSLYMAVACEFYADSEETIRLIEMRIKEPEIPYSELCTSLGISEGAARMRVSRFFRRVRERLEYGGVHPIGRSDKCTAEKDGNERT